MSTQGNGSPSAADFSTASSLGNVDPNSGLNSLNSGLMGPGAGTVPNGYITGNGTGTGSNYTTPDAVSGVSTGALNGNTSFGMPGSSLAQLAQASTNGQLSNVANAMGMGAKIANAADSNGKMQTGSGRVSERRVSFGSPIQNFAGSAGGSQVGNSLLQLLAKYHPGGA
jgi:hypothetical protein